MKVVVRVRVVLVSPCVGEGDGWKPEEGGGKRERGER